MTNEENIKRIKEEAFNKIRKLCSPSYRFPYSNFTEDGSYAEQRDQFVRETFQNMENELKKTNLFIFPFSFFILSSNF